MSSPEPEPKIVGACETGGEDEEEMNASRSSSLHSGSSGVQPEFPGTSSAGLAAEDIPPKEIVEVAEDGSKIPVLNMEIVENLCKVCPVEMIPKLRYVCKEWNEAALKAWRKTAKLVVVDSVKEPRKKKSMSYIQLRDLNHYSEDPNDVLKLSLAKDYKYSKYKLEGWYLTNQNPDMVKFWENLGSSISHLEFSNLRVDKMETVLAILYQKTPNLHTLILENVFVRQKNLNLLMEEEVDATIVPFVPQEKLKVLKVRNLEKFPVSWTEFFQHFPKIEGLEFFDVKTDSHLIMMLNAINSIRTKSDRNVLSLKSLAIIRGDANHKCVQYEFSSQLCDSLRECDFELEELTLKFGCKHLVSASVSTLEIFAQNVTKLVFHIDYKARNLDDVFPYAVQFPKLENLELYLWCQPDPSLSELCQHMPRLKILNVKGNRNLFTRHGLYYKKIISEGWLNPCESLQDFSFSFTNKCSNLSSTKFKYLRILAPNLTKLDLKIDDRIFRAVCWEYPNLIELRLSGRALTDNGVTQTKMPNISFLKKLKVLVLYDTKHGLTDKSVFKGFSRVPSLSTLEMSLPSNQISPEARRALEEKIQNLIVKPI